MGKISHPLHNLDEYRTVCESDLTAGGMAILASGTMSPSFSKPWEAYMRISKSFCMKTPGILWSTSKPTEYGGCLSTQGDIPLRNSSTLRFDVALIVSTYFIHRFTCRHG